jgi:putative oxidoreductase
LAWLLRAIYQTAQPFERQTQMILVDVSLLVLRLVVGVTFAGHGAQKAFGWWNGPGPQKWEAAMTAMRFHPARFWAVLSIGVELIGGLLLALGFLTPWAATALIGQSMVIILKAHLPKGFWNRDGGFEFPLALAAGVVAVMGVGAGGYSIDAAIAYGLPEAARWLLLGIGIVGGLAAYWLSQLAPASESAPQQR